MKFGVDAPWYQDSVERVAFNLYAMDCERLNAIAEEIMTTYAGDIVDIDMTIFELDEDEDDEKDEQPAIKKSAIYFFKNICYNIYVIRKR